MTGSTKPTVVIVDPLSTGAYLVDEFAARGWSSIAVLSSPDTPPVFGRLQHADKFREVIVGDNIDRLESRLATQEPHAVIAGTEIGVPLADELSERLCLPGNGTKLSASRRDKNAMAEALTRCGLRAPETMRSSDCETILKWAEARAVWPIVVKPTDSAGSDGVTFCTSPAQVRAAFDELYGTRNRMGAINTMVLAQEFLNGQQYNVNTISVDGRHHVAEIWKDNRRTVSGGRLVYDVEELLAPIGHAQEKVSGYVLSVLDALGISWGPAHSEVMLTSDGPVLIETAARMMGSILPRSVEAATGHSHVTLTVDCYTNPERVIDLIGKPYPVRRSARVVSLIAPHDGYLSRQGALQIAQLPTLHGVVGDMTVGSPVQRTVDLFTSPAALYLISQSSSALERDIAQIRKIEQCGLYLTDRAGSATFEREDRTA